MSETIRIIEAIGQQWPFLVVVFVIVTIIINRKHIGDYVSNISTIRLKKGENEISFDRKPTGYTKEKGLTPHDESNSTNRKSDIRLLSKSEASLMLFKKLEDPSVSNIKIITYTNEVEAGQINQYKVKGNKTIEIYKKIGYC